MRNKPKTFATEAEWLKFECGEPQNQSRKIARHVALVALVIAGLVFSMNWIAG